MIWKYLFFLYFLQTFSTRSAVSKSIESRFPVLSASIVNKTLEKVFRALDRLLLFFKREHKDLILDGVYGLRVLEGSMKKIIEANEKNEIVIPQRMKKRISSLQSRASRISKLSLPYLIEAEPHYYDVVGFVVADEWNNIKPLRNRIFNHINKNNDDDDDGKDVVPDNMQEEVQDRCFRGLAGNAHMGLKPCNITEECWRLNTLPDATGYHLTHQLMYILLGEVKGCTEVFESKMRSNPSQKDVGKFLSQSCHRMYLQMLEQEKITINKKILDDIDLYMEQGVICGMLGYSQFFSLYRLNLILGWMHPKGCFGYHDDVKRNPDEEDKRKGETSDKEMKTMRQLQNTKEIQGGCELHSSGVGTGLLALYLRWLIYIYNQNASATNTNEMYHNRFHLTKSYWGTPPGSNVVKLLVVIAIFILVVISRKKGILKFLK